MFVKAVGKKLYEEVVTQIKHLINTKQLKDGDMLPSEEELSRNIGVSRATVREGLRVLELMGLVETKRGKGTFVRLNNEESIKKSLGNSFGCTYTDLYSVYEIDRLLEPSIAKLVAEKATDEDILKIKLALDKEEEAKSNGRTGKAETLYFHECIIAVLNNPILNSIFELTREIHKRGRKITEYLPDRSKQCLQEHFKIYDAIRTRKGNKAYYYMEKHLDNVGHSYDKICLIDKDSEDTK